MDYFQSCLQDTESCLLRHAQLADKEGICFGVKLVRGAYMDGEKINAERDGLPGKICLLPMHNHNHGDSFIQGLSIVCRAFKIQLCMYLKITDCIHYF